MFRHLRTAMLVAPMLVVLPSTQQARHTLDCTAAVSADQFPNPVAVNSSGNLAYFIVTNTGATTASISPTCSATKTLSCTGKNPATFSLPPNGSQGVTVTFSAGGAATFARVILEACGTSADAFPINVQ